MTFLVFVRLSATVVRIEGQFLSSNMSFSRTSSPSGGNILNTDENNIPLLDPVSSSHVEANDDPAPQLIKRKPFPTSPPATPFLHRSSNAHAALETSSCTQSLVPENSGAPVVNERCRTQNCTQRTCTSMSRCLIIQFLMSLDSTKEPVASSTGSSREHRVWFPYTLGWLYLTALLASSLVLLAVLIYLHRYSRNNHGLGDYGGQSVLLFGWRFAPTLIATLYAFLFNVLLDDVKRTEPYARLAKLKGGSADSTVLKEPGAWWNALIDGFSRTKNGGVRSWPLVLSATSLMIALLVISPLSSSVLITSEVSFTDDIDFYRKNISQQSPLKLGDQVVPRFRTISNRLQNITTSAWITEDFVVLPFWPQTISDAPLGALLGTSSEVWRAETTVFKSEISCEPLRLNSRSVKNAKTSYGHSLFSSITLETNDECVYQLAMDNSTDFSMYGGASWARPELLTIMIDEDMPDGISETADLTANITGDVFRLNYTQPCLRDEILLLSTPWFDGQSWASSLQIAGQICSTHYYAADIPVSLATTESGSVVTFNENDFSDKQNHIDAEIFNNLQFEDFFLSPNWTYHLATPQTSYPRPSLGGPSAVIGAMYNFSMLDAINDVNLFSKAAKMKQRYFGEAVISSFSERADTPSDVIKGQITSVRLRIVVAQAIAFTLEALLIIEIVLILAFCWVIKLQRRRILGISSDPARSTTVAALISDNAAIQHKFQILDKVSPSGLEKELRGTRFRTSHYRLFAIDEVESVSQEPKQGKLLNYIALQAGATNDMLNRLGGK